MLEHLPTLESIFNSVDGGKCDTIFLRIIALHAPLFPFPSPYNLSNLHSMVLPQRFKYPKSSTAHGGSLSVGKRKTTRPIAVKDSLHVVLRAENARGKYSLLLPKNARLIHRLLSKYGKQFEVKAYDFAFVGNHMHLLIKSKTKRGLQNFLRVFCGQSAQKITGALKGSPLRKRFWDLLVFSRIIVWGRAFKIVKNYIHKNITEGAAIRKVSWLNTS